MPKRVIDFDAMWGSDKIASCADWAQAEYAWLYGLADASGCFEITNLRVIWGRVAAVRGNFTIERLEQVFAEFQDKGLLFAWAHEGKRYAHWTGSDVPGRLPPPSWRMRLEKFAPPVPKEALAEYMARFARGRAALAGAGFRAESAGKCESNLKIEISNLKSARVDGSGEGLRGVQRAAAGNENRRMGGAGVGEQTRPWKEMRDGNQSLETGLKGGVEGDQGQDWDLNLSLDLKRIGKWELDRERVGSSGQFADLREGSKSNGNSEIKNDSFYDSNAESKANTTATAKANALTGLKAEARSNSDAGVNSRAGSSELNSNSSSRANCNCHSDAEPRLNARGYEMQSAAAYRMSARDIALERELRVGAGPVCGPVRIRPEVLERIRLREEARARAGTR